MGKPVTVDRDWATDLTDRLDDIVAKVRAQTTDRIRRVVRLIIYGLVAVLMGGMAAVLAVIAAVRAADRLIPQEVWLAYLIMGGLFTAAGGLLWSKRERRLPDQT